MAIKFLAGINLEKNELQNPKIHNLASDPSGAVVGQMYYNTSDNQLKFYDGAWKVVSSSAGTMTSFTLTADSGTNQTVSNSNTVDIAGGSGISTVVGATDTVTVNLSNIANDTLLGNNSGSGAAPTALNATNVRSILNVADGATANTGSLADLDSVATDNITDASITTAKLAADAVTAAKIADDAISDEHLDVTAITGQTDLGNAFADGDTLLVYDTSASALKEGTVKNLANYMQSELTFTTNTDTDVSATNLKTRLAGFTSADTVNIGDSGNDTTVVIRGNLTVAGTTTTVNTETLTINDNIIVLNKNSADTPTENAGIEVERGTAANVLLRYNETNDEWEFTNDGSTYQAIPVADTNTQLSKETVQDYVGEMFTGNTETGITVTYQDGTNDVDFVVSDTTVAGDTGSTGITPGDTLTIAGGTNVTTAMSGDTLTITATDTNTQLSNEQVQDIVGAMFNGNTETNITATYQDADGTIDLVATNTQLSQEQVEDYVGGMLDGTETGITVTYDDTDGNIDFVVDTATASAIGRARVAAGAGIDVSVASGVFTVSGETASSSNAGIVELATNSETTTGTDTARATTPANVKAAIDARSAAVILRGDGSTTAHSITHNLGTRDVIVQVVDYGNDGTGATYENVMVDVTRTSTSAVTVTFAVAPTTSEDYRVLIYKVV